MSIQSSESTVKALKLEHEHDPVSISSRLSAKPVHGTLGDFVLGSVDGTITTFAIVSGVAGAGLSPGIAAVLGFSNVFADGFSMAVSGYLKAQSDVQALERYRAIEEKHILHAPDGEREEIRQIYAAKGFDGEILEKIVETICADRELWVDAMLVDEYGLQLGPQDPKRAAIVTFASFVTVGSVPLLPMILTSNMGTDWVFQLSALVTATMFLIIGAVRGIVVKQSIPKSAISTFLVGGIAAALAYGTGALLQGLVGVSG